MSRAPLNGTIESARVPCGDYSHHITACGGLRRPREGHGVQAEHKVSEGPGLRLANLLSVLMRHAPTPAPAACTADAAASALEQDSEGGPVGSWHAVHPGPCGAGGAARVRGMEEEGRGGGPASGMARCNGGRLVVDGADVAAVRQGCVGRGCMRTRVDPLLVE
ncbi:hypothetical protein LdCL_340014350 [Leishmania donovani]|uniref:Uncharacterized protein n=1 Tax=Leishmania donovani TaxID=5661 RepID=A0A3S7X7M3_LEIDO|nr:hypothetical protein LdCL_340014350 [Leishmania donovani]